MVNYELIIESNNIANYKYIIDNVIIQTLNEYKYQVYHINILPNKLYYYITIENDNMFPSDTLSNNLKPYINSNINICICN